MILTTLWLSHHIHSAPIHPSSSNDKRSLSNRRTLHLFGVYKEACPELQNVSPTELILTDFQRRYLEPPFANANALRSQVLTLIDVVDGIRDQYHERVIPEDRLDNVPVFGLDTFLQDHTLFQQIILEQKAVTKLVTWFQHVSKEERRLEEIIVNNFSQEIHNVLQRLQNINCLLAPMHHTTVSLGDINELDRIFHAIKYETKYLPLSGTRRISFRRDYILFVETDKVLRAIIRTIEQVLRKK